MPVFLEYLKTLAALWHILAFAGGFFFVWQSYRALFGFAAREPHWGACIRKADIHLWLSGFAVIGLGILTSGFDKYLSNPKLWAKVVLITVWLVATQAMRHYAVPRLKAGRREPMVIAAAVSLACWVYGAFLGVAHGLAYGAVPFSGLLVGYLGVILASLGVSFVLAARPQYMAKA